MLLIITNSRDSTADYLCSRLAKSNITYLRFDSDTDLQSLKIIYESSGPRMKCEDCIFHPGDFDHVWFRRPHPINPTIDGDDAEVKHTREEWSEAIEGFFAHIPIDFWMNHPSRNACASHKMEQLTRARKHDLIVPDTIVTQSPERLREFWLQCGKNVITKPLASGYLERKEESEDSLIYTNQVTEKHIDDLNYLEFCPTIFQKMVQKELDVRVCIVDSNIHAVGLNAIRKGSHQRLDIRRNNMMDVSYTQVDIPTEISKKLSDLVNSYGLRFAAVDMAIDQEKNWVFFEINPNGQWAWLDIVAGTDIASMFIQAFSQAGLKRIS